MSLQLKMPLNSERPARVDLLHAGRIKDSGARRFTLAGRKAAVWVVVE
jgi:hypothetical protein